MERVRGTDKGLGTRLGGEDKTFATAAGRVEGMETEVGEEEGEEERGPSIATAAAAWLAVAACFCCQEQE
jgi:hypothetical protein